MIQTLASWHPFVIHFAVAFSIGSAAFDIVDFFRPSRRLEQTGYMLMLAAVPFLLLAVLTGNLAETILSASPGNASIENHMNYANIAVWVFTGAGMWRLFLTLKHRYIGMRKVIYIFIITAASMSVYLAAVHGGKIIDHGLRPVTPEAHVTRQGRDAAGMNNSIDFQPLKYDIGSCPIISALTPHNIPERPLS